MQIDYDDCGVFEYLYQSNVDFEISTLQDSFSLCLDPPQSSWSIISKDGLQLDNVKSQVYWNDTQKLLFQIIAHSVGISQCTPKQILQFMPQNFGMKREQISSHLQKYRLKLAKEHGIYVKSLSNLHFPKADCQYLNPIKEQWKRTAKRLNDCEIISYVSLLI